MLRRPPLSWFHVVSNDPPRCLLRPFAAFRGPSRPFAGLCAVIRPRGLVRPFAVLCGPFAATAFRGAFCGPSPQTWRFLRKRELSSWYVSRDHTWRWRKPSHYGSFGANTQSPTGGEHARKSAVGLPSPCGPAAVEAASEYESPAHSPGQKTGIRNGVRRVFGQQGHTVSLLRLTDSRQRA